MANAEIFSIIPAAGLGARIDAAQPKQYILLNNKPVLMCSYERLHSVPVIKGIVIGINPDDQVWPAYAGYFSGTEKFMGTSRGGAERADTVLNAIHTLLDGPAKEDDWVLVHDAARPCVMPSDIINLINEIQPTRAGGILATLLGDTLKRVNGREIQETIPRDQLWCAATPQMFRIGILVKSLSSAGQNGDKVTDEAMAIEKLGYTPKIVPGRRDNIKITWPEDIAYAKLIIQYQLEEGVD